MLLKGVKIMSTACPSGPQIRLWVILTLYVNIHQFDIIPFCYLTGIMYGCPKKASFVLLGVINRITVSVPNPQDRKKQMRGPFINIYIHDIYDKYNINTNTYV